MKLVAAKCPSCGANIKVDKNSDSTICDYCNSKIIVEDAVAKYKLEVSGEIEIKNLPKIENHLKMGAMHYNDREYEEAYKEYEKVCDLDPNNYLALLRKGISKSLSSNYNNLDVQSSVNGVKKAYNILKKEENVDININSSISECNSALVTLLKTTIDFYNNNKSNMNLNDIADNINRIINCLDGFDYIKSLTINNNELKIVIIDNMLETIDMIMKSRPYSSGTYTINSTIRKEMIKKKNELNIEKNNIINSEKINDITNLKENNNYTKIKTNSKNKSNNTDIYCIIAAVIFAHCAFGSICYLHIVSAILFVVITLLFIPKIKQLLIDKYKLSNELIIIIRVILIIAVFIVYSIEYAIKYPYAAMWKADNETIDISTTNVTYSKEDGKRIYETYKRKKQRNRIIIEFEDTSSNEIYTFQYENNKLCLLKNNKCIKEFEKDAIS